MGEAKLFGMVIHDPVWYLVIYPVVFGVLYGIFTMFRGNFDLSDALIAISSAIFAGIITLLLRSRAKK